MKFRYGQTLKIIEEGFFFGAEGIAVNHRCFGMSGNPLTTPHEYCIQLPDGDELWWPESQLELKPHE